MAYFSALGGTGGTSATITVTYSEDFYGLTITATNGTTTLTKTATSSGTLVFDVSEGGTWVVSGTVEGATYSEQVDVFFEYTVPPLVALPDGSTALPVNDIQMWLKCAGIRDKTTYTTLSDVLGDTETLIALCADSNACNYMARSTNWASGVAADSTAMLIVGKYNYCANALLGNSTWASALLASSYADYLGFESVVPTMTSDTTPSGEAIGSSIYTSAYDYYKAFDNNSSTFWNANGGQGEWVGYKGTNPVVVNKLIIDTTAGGTEKVGTIQLQGKSGDTWIDIGSSFTPDSFPYTFIVGNSTPYTEHRVINISGTTDFNVTTLQFYGRTDNANYIPLVPRMTSNTTPSGEVTASGEYSSVGRYAWKAFDGSASGDIDQWQVTNTTSGWIAYKFPQAILANAVMIKPSPSSYGSRIKDFQIIGSNDDFATTDILYSGTMPNEYANVTWHTYMFLDNAVAYRSYKVNVLNTYDTQSNIGAYEIQFYRKSDLPIIHSAVEDNIFYMDDGSPVALCGIPVGDTIDVDMESFKGQTLTLVSTVAKDPTNLSNDFSMNVRITPNITEIYLMPVGALYWWGSMYNLEEISSVNGWTMAYTYKAPTYNKDNIAVSISNQQSGVSSKNAITATDAHWICQTSDKNAEDLMLLSAKNRTSTRHIRVVQTSNNTIEHCTGTTTSATGYATYEVVGGGSATGTLYAMWFE